VTDNSQDKKWDTDSTVTGAAVLSSSLCLPENLKQQTNEQENGNQQPMSDLDVKDKIELSNIIDSKSVPPCENSEKCPKEAQGSTDDGVAAQTLA